MNFKHTLLFFTRCSLIVVQEPLDSLGSDSLWSVLVPKAEDNDQSQGKDVGSGATGSPSFDDELRAEHVFFRSVTAMASSEGVLRSKLRLLKELGLLGQIRWY